jgi:hypothetical protein
MGARVLVGLSPFRYASFAALKHTYGRLWVRCDACRRYDTLATAPIRDRDSRYTTFSCSVCGAEGKVVLDDPAQQGFAYDPRQNPQRHPAAFARITGRTYVRWAPSRAFDPPKHRR